MFSSAVAGPSTRDEPTVNGSSKMLYHFNSVVSSSMKREIEKGNYDSLRMVPTQVIYSDGTTSLSTVPDAFAMEREIFQETSSAGLPNGTFIVFSAPVISGHESLIQQIRYKAIISLMMMDFAFAVYILNDGLSGHGSGFWADGSDDSSGLQEIYLDFISSTVIHAAGFYGLRKSNIRLLLLYCLCLVMYIITSVAFGQASLHLLRVVIQSILLYQVNVYHSRLMFTWHTNSIR